MQRLRFAALVLLSCALAACGYQLRGAYELPAQLSPLYLDKETMSLQLYRELRTTFKASGAEITEDAATAASVLAIDLERQARDVISVDSLGRAREYRLIYRLRFSLRSSGENIIEKSNIQLTRTLLFDPEAVLGVAEETQIIYRDMIRDSTDQILLRLQALRFQDVET